MLRDQNVLLLERTGRLGGKVKTITIGNIQLCGDYTHRVSYLAGAAYSSLRAARALGSKHVVPGDKEVVLPDPPRWGRFGFASLAAAVAGVVAAVIGFTA
jgi:hypothetical protein